MFTTLIVQPIFNVLVLIYALLPGHNFGLAIIIFTIVVRIVMWPLVKKQLHHAKAMRALQPELKKIKQATKGDRQKESLLVMQLYKEREINPFSSLGLVIVQIPLLLALYSGLNRIVKDPYTIVDFSYPILRELSWLKELATDIGRFDNTLLGFIDLARPAIDSAGTLYLPAFLIVFGSAVAQFYQTKQLMPNDKDAKKIRQILREAKEGKQADQSEMAQATTGLTRYFIPVMVFVFTIGLPAALPLYWLTTSLVAILQQAKVLKRDETELEAIADASDKTNVIEGEVIPPKHKNKKAASKKSKKRRK